MVDGDGWMGWKLTFLFFEMVAMVAIFLCVECKRFKQKISPKKLFDRGKKRNSKIKNSWLHELWRKCDKVALC